MIEQPLPTVNLTFHPITDDCAGSIGLKTSILLTGSPPFKLHYRITHNNHPPKHASKTIQYSRDEIQFLPDRDGEWEYEFLRVDDAFYEGVEVGGAGMGRKVRQVVHPLAGAGFRRGGRDERIWSCEGESVKTEVELVVRTVLFLCPSFFLPCRVT